MRVVLAPSALHTACGCLWENNAPAALHAVVGRQGRLRRLHAFLFCHAGGFGAFGATYCLWLLMGKQCACGATRGCRETGSPAATTCFFVLPCGWFWRLRRYILLVAAYGKTMRLRRYTRLSGDRVACGDYMLFCFAMRVFWRLRRDILLVSMIASSPRTAPPIAFRSWWG